MISMNSTLREVCETPVGKDIVDMLARSAGPAAKFLANPLVMSMRMSVVHRMLQKTDPGLVPALLRVVANEPGTPPVPTGPAARAWWKEAVVYQIYPRSFQDSNGDGIGDLPGITSRLPYLKDLGVDVIWLSPIYDSPNDDMGYDIRDYKKIMKEFGKMADFTKLLAEVHKNGMKLIMDLVVNHTSDEHAWFKKALADPQAPEKDYYIWGEGKNGTEPNNWTSLFSGPAWNYYPKNDEWALHLFSKKQMDLNWDNPALRAEVYEMVNWWLDKGVDGFRMDVINFISKDSLADGDPLLGDAVGICGIEHYFYGPRLHEYLQEMRREAFDGRDVFSVGETPGVGLEMSKMLAAEERKELDMVFNFDQLDPPGKSRMNAYEYDLRYLKSYYMKWQAGLGENCWQSLFFENHDNPRMVSKVNPDPAWRLVIAKLLAVMLLTLRGTPFIYQGQELGMTNSQFSKIEDLRDVESLTRYNEILALSENMSDGGWRDEAKEMAFSKVAWGTRDHARTPMQWDNTKHAGFTEGEPWLGVNPNYPVINAKSEQENPDSVFNFFKELIAARKGSEALVYGAFHPVFTREKDVFCYFRLAHNEKYYVEINLTGDDRRRPGPLTAEHRLVAGNYGGISGRLRPYEANVYRVGGPVED